jgi:hypothetical protein
MKDVPHLRRLARRLHRQIGHLKFYADCFFLGAEACNPASQTRQLTIALTGFEYSSLMWLHYRRLKAVQAEIRRRSKDQ